MMWAPHSATDSEGSQEEIARAVVETAALVDAPVAPIGPAWEAIQEAHPGIGLWQSDRVHASKAGTYLMACVLFTTLWGQSPLGLTYTADLSPADAEAIQEIAAEVVAAFANPSP